jgi:hypothetical protein
MILQINNYVLSSITDCGNIYGVRVQNENNTPITDKKLLEGIMLGAAAFLKDYKKEKEIL